MLGELLGDGQLVDRLAVALEAQDRGEDPAVLVEVEVLGAEPHVEDDRVIADSETIIAPSTDSSASRFCGGMFGF